MAVAMLKLKHYPIIMHVHDEIVIECDENNADTVLNAMKNIMGTPPTWARDLPVTSEGEISQRFGK